MIVIATGFIPLSPLSVVLTMLCGKAVSGLERILCGVLVKRTPGKHVFCPSQNKFHFFESQNSKILDMITMKALEKKSNMTKSMTFIHNRVENIVGKTRKLWFLAFSPFHNVFDKLYPRGC